MRHDIIATAKGLPTDTTLWDVRCKCGLAPARLPFHSVQAWHAEHMQQAKWLDDATSTITECALGSVVVYVLAFGYWLYSKWADSAVSDALPYLH